jgi:hypothetical protein
MIIWRNLLDPYAAIDHPAVICDISYLEKNVVSNE